MIAQDENRNVLLRPVTKMIKKTLWLGLPQSPPGIIITYSRGKLTLNLQLPLHPGKVLASPSSLGQLFSCTPWQPALRLLSHFTCDTVILLSTLPFEPFVSTNLGTNFGARRYLGQDSYMAPNLQKATKRSAFGPWVGFDAEGSPTKRSRDAMDHWH